MEKMKPILTLNNGVEIPCIGTGPGEVLPGKGSDFLSKIPRWGYSLNLKYKRYNYQKNKELWVESVAHCLQLGYHLIDYSAAYGNEELLGEAIRKSGVPREKLFITSRVTNKQQFEGKTREALLESLKKLGLDYIDLYMFHWPVTDCFVSTYKEMERLYREGLVKAIGVCNCHQHHLQKILDECTVVPALDQFEVHPLFTQKPLIAFCKEHGIQVEAYTPLARNDDRLQKNPILKRLAKKYNKSIAQIILRWDIQLGIIPIPRSSNFERQKQNIDIFDFELSAEEMAAIDSININSRLRFDPDNLDFTSVG